jgi:FkbM family methyltransferase
VRTPSPKKRVAVALFRGLIAAELAILLLAIGIWFFPQSGPSLLALAGRNEFCPIQDIWEGGRLRIELGETIEHIRENSRLLEEDPVGYEFWETPAGSYWVPAGNGGSLPILVAQQVVNQYGDGAQTVQPGDVVLDGGAHVGIYVREALERGASQVIAIEPAPNNVECLRRNLKEEIAAGRVIVYPKGIWDVEAELPFWEDPDNSAADGFIHKAEDFKTIQTIPLVPIDLLIDELHLDRVDVIKMDIKGAVTRVLHGASRTLAQHSPRLIIAAEDGDNPRDILATLSEVAPGYETRCSSCSVVQGWRVEPDILLLARNH